MEYQEKKFNLPEMEGLSKNSVEQHLALYGGYVKNYNAMIALRHAIMKEENAHAIAELTRRLSFEWNGMRLHEYYFSQWEKGPHALGANSALAGALSAQYGTPAAWEKEFRNVGMMRGPGWAILYFDPQTKSFHNAWVDQHHQGHLATLPIILALDVWEHAFVIDYGTAGRGKYIESCFKNYNWDAMEERYERSASAISGM